MPGDGLLLGGLFVLAFVVGDLRLAWRRSRCRR